jgi:hypothetical protein
MTVVYTTAEIMLLPELLDRLDEEGYALQEYLRDTESEVLRDLELGWDNETGRIYITANADGEDFFEGQKVIQDGIRFALARYTAGRGEIFKWMLITSWDEADDVEGSLLRELGLE